MANDTKSNVAKGKLPSWMQFHYLKILRREFNVENVRLNSVQSSCNLTENLSLTFSCVKNYSDISGLKDYTGIVFTIKGYGNILKSYTSIRALVADKANLSKLDKQGKTLQKLKLMNLDFV